MPKNKQKGLTDFVVKAQDAPALPESAEVSTDEAEAPKPAFTIVEREIPTRPGRKASLSYPIADLVPGTKQAFFVAAIGDAVKKTVASLRTFAKRQGFKVVIREDAAEGGVFVWRKA
jgi:hypothetical protein